MNVKDRQALLREYVQGTLLSDLYLSACPREQKLHATRRMLDAVESVWRTTLIPTPTAVDYVEQIRRRLPDAFVLHPELETVAKTGLASEPRAGSVEELLEAAAGLEVQIAPPFSVGLHGDFNANNVIYNPEADQIKFIDEHRSQLGDYLQDIGVFLLSMVRRPDLTKALEADVEAINAVVEDFARAFGWGRGDHGFYSAWPAPA